MSDEHTSPIKTPKQLLIVLLAAFAVPISLFILLSQLVTGLSRQSVGESQDDVLARIKPVGELTLAKAATAGGSMSGEAVFQSTCKTCHEPGLVGAPKVGDAASWGPSIKKGYDVLLQHALNGFQEPGKVMPPRGGNTNLSDIEVARAVVYMANKSGASFKEPASPAPAAATATAAATAAPASSAVAPASAAAVVPANAGKTLDLAAAENLMKKDACAACHSVDKRIVGPAYRDVAAKYRNDKDALTKLTQKVKSGGGGVWGPIPMPPNAQVPDEDIKQLVSWILTLK